MIFRLSSASDSLTRSRGEEDQGGRKEEQGGEKGIAEGARENRDAGGGGSVLEVDGASLLRLTAGK